MTNKLSVHIGKKELAIFCRKGESLHSALSEYGFFLPASCGGNGTCGKCTVLAKGSFEAPYGELASAESILACRAYPCGDCSVYLKNTTKKDSFTPYTPHCDGEALGVAIDVGTTCITALLCDLSTGEELSSLTEKNCQVSYGADVISRLGHDEKHLSEILINQINDIITKLCSKKSRIMRITLSGNTVISHYLAGLSTEGMKAFPFVMSDSFGNSFPAEDIGIKCKNAECYILPALGAFVGGDISAGILSCKMSRRKKTSLLIDIGTNGEIALGNASEILVASAAAGPAFEGGELKFGMPASDGAVIAFDGTHFTTAGNKKPCGIAGSGAIDIVAELLRAGVIDSRGRLLLPDEAPAFSSRLRIIDGESVFLITDDIYLTAGDVRRLQLAKAAISACVSHLMNISEKSEDDISTVFLSGAFGTSIKCENAAEIGLIPKSFVKKCISLGNTSLIGAKLALVSKKARRELSLIANKTKHTELSGSSDFEDRFIEHIPMYRTKTDSPPE